MGRVNGGYVPCAGKRGGDVWFATMALCFAEYQPTHLPNGLTGNTGLLKHVVLPNFILQRSHGWSFAAGY